MYDNNHSVSVIEHLKKEEIFKTKTYHKSAEHSQQEVSAHFKNKQILPFGFAEDKYFICFYLNMHTRK